MKSTNTQITGKEPIIINDNLQQHVHSTSEKTTITLESGKNTTTLNPGYMVPIMFKEVLAGEYIKEWHIDNLTRLIAPLVPTLDRSYINIQAYFVPHTRIWKDAEKALAGKDNTITAIPNITFESSYSEYSTFNRMVISRYGLPFKAGNTNLNLLLPRGYRAITNDFIINKDYGVKKTEWNESIPVQAEINALKGYTAGSIAPLSPSDESSMYVLEKAQTRKGYLTNIKKQIAVPQQDIDDGGSLIPDHLDWQTRFQDMKQRQDNANKNDWDIIAEMGGTQPVKTDRVEFLGQVDYELNFQQITQTAPEIDNSSPLGTTGSFSFTKAQGTLFSHKKFLQHGFIHILLSVGIDNYTENGTPKELLKTDINDIYRPGLAKKEVQLLMKQEIYNAPSVDGSAAYQPAWAEYKRLPSFVSGQMQTQTLTPTTLPENEVDETYLPVSNSQWHNFKAKTTEPIISDLTYFRDTTGVANVFARNNILSPIPYDSQWKVQPLLNMSEHKVTVQLPIESSTLSSSTKAEITR
mgnify:CR=1 FL=1